MADNKTSIKTLFKTKQAILESKLEVLLGHPVTKGEQCESAWIDFFRNFLPAKYAIDKGFVFDAEGNISEQIDVIIYDSLYSPLIFGTDAGEKFITAESVYAVFDSKPKINKGNLEYTSKKIETVRKLTRTSREIINAGKKCPARNLTRIVGGILAVDAVKTSSIETYLKNNTSIDVGCAIKETAFIVDRSREGADVQFSTREEAILAFFYIMLESLHNMGTVPCIDIRTYATKTVSSINFVQKGAND